MRTSSSPRRPRVAFISQGLGRIVPPKAHGSIATWTYQVARNLAPEQDVIAVEFGDHRFGARRESHEGVTYVYIGTALINGLNAIYSRLAPMWRRWWSPERRLLQPAYASIWHNLGFILQAAWITRRLRCDVIHIHNFSQFIPVVRFLNPSAHIAIHMNCEWLSQHDQRMIGHRVGSADIVIGCSGHIIRKVQARFPELEPKSRVVFNGADVEHFVPSLESVLAKPPQPLRILFVGRISPEKGVHLLVDAFAQVAERFPTAELHLVGGAGSLPADFLVALSDDPLVKGLQAFYGSDYLAEVKRRIPPHLSDRVRFHGNVGHSELAGHLREATIFANASLSDAFPLTVVEAMAAGLPVVASAVGGVRESVAHEVTGLLVDADSADALAEGLCRLLDDSELRRAMALAARERALTLFSWRAIASSVADVYRDTPLARHEALRPVAS